MKKVLIVFLAAFFLVACGDVQQVSISELEYKQVLGKAVCEVVDELNARGELGSEEAIANDFDPLLQKAVKEMGYSSKDWLAAKKKYFPDEEEHTKLVKLHFTWCLIGDSIAE